MTTQESKKHIQKLKEAKSSLEAIKTELKEYAERADSITAEEHVENITGMITTLQDIFEYYEIEFGQC